MKPTDPIELIREENAAHYYAAATYAFKVLGAEAEKHFPRLEQLSRFNSLDELKAVVDGLRPKPTPKPLPPMEPSPEPWHPCAHFGGEDKCERCKRENTAARNVLAIANKMYEQFHLFVKSRIHAESIPWTNGKTYHEFADLEQKVWGRITSSIENYENSGTPMAWLRVVVRAVVVNHFRDERRKKRDTRKTVQFDITAHDLVHPDSDFSVPAKPTAVPVKADA
jgi:hypothetical protein